MIDVVFATNNQNKIREFKSLFDCSKVNIKSLKDIGYTKEIIENGETFADNALIKAMTIAKEYGCTTISDDSGLCVEALGGAPGVYSARYAGLQHNDMDNNTLLVKNLANIENRKAKYVCAICIVDKNLNYRIVEDTCEGEIILTPRGANGFGYDPYFWFPSLGKTFAEVSLEEKNKYSHRAKAIRKIGTVCNEDFSFK